MKNEKNREAASNALKPVQLCACTQKIRDKNRSELRKNCFKIKLGNVNLPIKY